jgi:flagellar motor protein MotB
MDESLTSSTARASQLHRLQTTAKMIDVRDIIELVEDGRNVRNIPKLEAMVNYGEDTVLPEIIDVCNGVGERARAAGNGSRVRIRRKVRT